MEQENQLISVSELEEKKKDVLRETDAEAIRLARTLVRGARYGSLAFIDSKSGAPNVNRVGVATDIDGAPLILVSMLSAHTPAIQADPRCSLLVGVTGKGDPLAHPRITLACRATRLERGTAEHGRAKRRYLNRNPKAKLYVGLGDFSIFRLDPEGASLNAGFGKAYRLERTDLLVSGPVNDELAASEQAALDHMNADHLDAIAVYAHHFAKAGGSGWRITGLDADGMDLASGDDVLRVFFPKPLKAATELRPILVGMAEAGRAAEQPQS